MQVEGNMAPSVQAAVSNAVVREAAPAGPVAAALGTPEASRQQSALADLSITDILQQDGVVIYFSLDANNNFVVKIVNPFTGQVIKEIPPEQIASLAASLQQVAGVLVDKKV